MIIHALRGSLDFDAKIRPFLKPYGVLLQLVYDSKYHYAIYIDMKDPAIKKIDSVDATVRAFLTKLTFHTKYYWHLIEDIEDKYIYGDQVSLEEFLEEIYHVILDPDRLKVFVYSPEKRILKKLPDFIRLRVFPNNSTTYRQNSYYNDTLIITFDHLEGTINKFDEFIDYLRHQQNLSVDKARLLMKVADKSLIIEDQLLVNENYTKQLINTKTLWDFGLKPLVPSILLNVAINDKTFTPVDFEGQLYGEVKYIRSYNKSINEIMIKRLEKLKRLAYRILNLQGEPLYIDKYLKLLCKISDDNKSFVVSTYIILTGKGYAYKFNSLNKRVEAVPEAEIYDSFIDRF